MVTVVLLSRPKPRHDALARVIQMMRVSGARVVLAGMTDVESTHGDVGADVLRSLRRRVEVDPHLYRAGLAASSAEETWMYVQRDSLLMDCCRDADVIVALDPGSVFAVWKLGQAFPHAELRQGAMAGYQALQAGADRNAAEAREPDTLRLSAQASLSQRAQTAMAAVLASDEVLSTKIGQRQWIRTLRRSDASPADLVAAGVDAVSRLYRAGRNDAAAGLTSAMLEEIRRPRLRADLLGGVVVRLIDLGVQPPDLSGAVEAELRYADRLLERGSAEQASRSLMLAMHLAFHRAVHIDSTASPLAADPAGFTAPFRASSAMAVLRRQRGRASSVAPVPTERPPRVIVATHGDDHFVQQLRQDLVEHGGAELRSLDLSDLGESGRLARDPRDMMASLIADGGASSAALAESALRGYLDWADVIFVDWCTALARVVTLVDPGTTKVVVRLHSYEAFTRWPQLVDFSRVDELVFVSEHVRDLVLAEVPALSEPGRPHVRVVPNALDLKRFSHTKSDDALHTIGVIGYQVVAKDPRWALEVLRLLRDRDSRYRLRLIGHPFDGTTSAAAAAYGELFERELRALEIEGAVDRYGYTTDLPTALVDVGVVLCSSVREGAPVAFVEATASGAVPVVRDWPFFRGLPHGPRTMYPADWVVDTPEQAVERILATTADLKTWRSTTSVAAAHAIASWDIGVTRDRYDALLFGETPRY